MQRNLKTSKDNRGTYIYYGEDGSKVLIMPGENGVTEAMIQTLHSLDDEEVDNNRRETRRHNSLDEITDKDDSFIDKTVTIEESTLDKIESKDTQERVRQAVSTLKEKEEQIIEWLYLSPTPLSQAEVGKILGIAEDSVKKSAMRIRKKLKELL
ncbi:sigma-70 family RNA polymerase sigma factor [Clostridium sp. FP1]|uniref:sigma-70 family RNA polymerase sigma factor n=1 Tax=Clostridium sp. FP1 TaxID=2724076 RepID=UPI0013E91838|nr:sigma-70 family RNA polymerase sigma factor [Clostridium sp. FP1]MBZ9633326.1 sigma-70 family RNA polymerase sigma factor [Clostridium sp. FP1]